MKRTACWMSAALVVLSAGCEDNDHGPGGHSHGAAAPSGASDSGGGKEDDHGGHGKSIALGETKAAHFTVKAARDEGALMAGKETAIDAWIVGGAADPKPTTVRFWIGSADGKGALKAKAGLEKDGGPGHYHSHIELPAELAADAKLHVEIADAAGKTHLASVDLKR